VLKAKKTTLLVLKKELFRALNPILYPDFIFMSKAGRDICNNIVRYLPADRTPSP
jgi:hypothetical protein